MDISLVHTGLAAGAALAALPVILHLFMRQTPKHIIFPALRLIRERQKRSKKRLRVKNWLLLLARMALLALMALALARPRIVSEASIGDQEVPTAMGLVFDTSLSMGYKPHDKNRLDEAKERALDLLKKTPSTSQVFVVDSSLPGVPQPLSPAAARKRVEGLSLKAVNRTLNVAVGEAYAAVTGSVDLPRHEVYVLTDLARTGWDTERPAEGLDKAAADKAGLKTYVLRLTPPDVHDVAIVDARPTADVVTEGEPVEVVAKIRSLGPATSRLAEVMLDGVRREKKTVDLPADGELEVRFTLPKADASVAVHQGEVRVSGAPDPVAFDDVRYFTFRVKPPTNVLVVSEPRLPEDGEILALALDPDPATLPPGAARPYRVERITTDQFLEKSENLAKRYRCVFLNNVRELSDAEWSRLSGFVLEGGGLVVGLGRLSQRENYAGTTASQLLPATPDAVKSPAEPTTFGQVVDYSHPLFSRYPRVLGDMLAQVPVYRYWGVKPHEGSRVLIRYADKSPALVERIFKGSRNGRVLLWTTPLSRRADPKSADAWNEFPNPLLGWSFLHLMNQTVAYLSGTTEEGLNFEAGPDVRLPIDAARRSKNYIVSDPDRKPSDRLSPPSGSDTLVIVAPQQVGNWSVTSAGTDGKGETTGFSVNPPVTEMQFVPMEAADLNKIFGGKDKYALASDPESLDKVVSTVRVGRELFPWLMMLIMIVVSVEGVLANRFYRESGPRPALGEA